MLGAIDWIQNNAIGVGLRALARGALLLGLVATPLSAAQQVTYGYDALGRLVAVSRPDSATSYAYDPANNRTTVATTSASSPPVAGNDTIYAMTDCYWWWWGVPTSQGSYFILGNDYDPDPGDSITLVSVTGNPSAAPVFYPWEPRGMLDFRGPIGSYNVSLTYTIRDNAGLTATGQINMVFYDPDPESC